MEASEGICVGIRMRPLNERELASGQQMLFQCMASANAVAQMRDGAPVEGQVYYFDKVFDEKSSTGDVYSHIGKNIVQGVMNGINGTIFAYGQTSSGKTHTMLGGGDQKGVLNMAAEDIFNFIAEHPNRDFLLRASFVEIYNENIRDLLSDSADATVAIREDPRKGVYCEASECMITDFDSITRLLRKGSMKRTVEATAMNETSSRSHTIFKLVVESRESNRDGRVTDGAVLVAALNLVDLAGSESVRHTGAMGQRAKEGGKINQSLLSLSRVIHSLSQPGAHVNFRDSKLTRLLQPSLSGNARMSIVCCVTPADRYLEETRSTLQFASRAKLVVTHATVNEVVDEAAQIRRLKQEIEVLKAQQKGDFSSVEELTRLESEKLELLQQLDLKCDQEVKLSACLDEMEQSNAFFRSEIERYQNETDEMKNKLMMMDELAAAKEYYEQQVHALKLSMEEQTATLNDQVLSLKTEVEAYEEKVSSMGMALLDKDDKIEQLEQDLYSAASAEEKAAHLQEKLDDLQASFAAQEALFASEKEAFDAQLQAMRNEKDTLLEEMNALKEELESYTTASEEKMAQLQQELVEMQVQLQAKEEESAAVRDAEWQQLQEQVAQLTEMKESMAEEMQSFEEKFAAQEEESNLLMQEKETLLEEKEALQANVNEKLVEIEALTAAKDSLETNFQQLQQEMATLKEQLALYTSQMEELRVLNEQLSEEKQATNDAESEALLEKEVLLEELQLKMDDLQATFTAQEALFASEKEEMTAQLQEMNAMKAVSDEKLQQLEAEIAHLQQTLQEQNAKQSMDADKEEEKEEEVDRLYVEIEQLQSTVTELSVEKSCLSEHIASLQEQLTQQQSTIDEQTAAFHSIMQEKQSLTEQFDATRVQLEETTATLHATQEDMARVVADYQAKLAEATSFAQELEMQLEEMKLIGETAALEKEELQTALETLQATMATSSMDSETLQTAMEVMKRSQETRLAEKDATLAATQQQMDVVTQQLEANNVLMEELNEEKNALEVALNEKREETASLAAQVEDLQGKLETVLVEKEQWNDEMSALKASMEEKESETQALNLAQEEEMAKKNEEIALLTEEVSLANETVAEMAQQIESLTAQVTSLASEKLSLETFLSKKDEELATLSAQLQQQHQSNVTLSRLSEIELTSEKIEDARRELQRQLETRQVEMGKLENELAHAWQEKNELLTRVKAAEETVAQYNLEFTSANDTETQNKKKTSQLQTQVDLLLGEKDSLVLKLKTMENEHKTTLDRAVLYAEGLETQCRELNLKLEKLESDKSQLMRLQEALKASEQHIVVLKQEKQDAKEALHVMQEDMKRLQETYDTVYEECVALREGENHLDQVKTLQEELFLWQTRHSETQQDLQEATNRFKKAKEDANMWQTEYERTVSQLELVSQEKQQLTQSLETALDDVQKLTMALNETSALLSPPTSPSPALEMWQERVAELETQLSETQLQLTATQKASESVSQDLQEKCVAQEQELTQLRDTVTQLEKEVGETQAAYDTLFCDSVTLREQIADLNDRNDQLQQHVEQLQLQQQQQVDGAESETAALEETLTHLQDTNRALEDEVSRVSQVNSDLIAKISDLETQIADFDRVAAQEQASLMDAAEVQMQALRNEIETLSATLTQSQTDLESQKSQISSLRDTVTHLEGSLEQANETIIELETSLAMQKQQMPDNVVVNDINQDKEEEILSLKTQLSVAETQIVALQETLVQKDARIQHLDACKLTKDQMEKIKVMKEERKKFQEDAKNLKRQLTQLKQTYDDLKASLTTRVAAPSQEFVISDLKFQLAETHTQLQNGQNLVSLLKEKLKECSQQLDEYEKERHDVLCVLEKHGVDVSQLLLNNNNNSVTHETQSGHSGVATQQDLADAVTVLAERLVTLTTQVSLQQHQRQQQQHDTETRLRESVATHEENKAQKLALERRLDQTKASLRDTREELAALVVERDTLLERVASLQEELKTAERKAVSSSEFVSSEVQVLEEENIELMRENKELRIELTRLKATSTSTVSAPPCSSSAAKAQQKSATRVFGVELDVNVVSSTNNSNFNNNNSAKKTPKRSLAEMQQHDTAATQQSQDENQVPGMGVSASGMKRAKTTAEDTQNKVVRKVKAKPLSTAASANATQQAMNTSVSAGGEEMPGECAQS